MTADDCLVAQAAIAGLLKDFWSVWPTLTSGALFDRKEATEICQALGRMEFSCQFGLIQIGNNAVFVIPNRNKGEQLIRSWAQKMIDSGDFPTLRNAILTGVLNTGHERRSPEIRRKIKRQYLPANREEITSC